MEIPLLDLKSQYIYLKDEIKLAIDEVLESQHFILGPKVKRLEEEISAYSQCKYALGTSSGTDAILLALMALGIGQGDIVVTSPYTFFATAGCIARVGAIPMFVDIDPDTYNICPYKLEELLVNLPKKDLSKVKAVISVHLFGQMADMGGIVNVCKKYNLRIIEDAAQAIGAEYIYNGEVKRAGSIGDIGCFSFFPSKNLGGYGDGGMVVTGDEDLYNKMKVLRTHGSHPKYYHKYIGGNFRLDEMQASILLVKLKYLDKWTNKRQENAKKYDSLFSGINIEKSGIFIPKAVYKDYDIKHYHIYNQYVIKTEKRNNLKEFLSSHGIATEIYYPLPMHLQECFAYLGHVKGNYINAETCAEKSLAIPIYPELKDKAIQYVYEKIRDFALRS